MTEKSLSYNEHHFTVPSDSEGMRLDQFLKSEMPDYSRTYIKTFIDAGHLKLDNKILAECSYRVKANESFTFSLPEKNDQPEVLEPCSTIPLDIVFEDEHMMVINKQSGLTVHPGTDFNEKTLVNILLHHCGDNLPTLGEHFRKGIVHRLDKLTTGLMLTAKTDQAFEHLSRQIKERSLKREYQAITWEVPHPFSGTVETQVAHSEKSFRKMRVVEEGGKEAITHYRVKEIFGDNLAALVECRLQTGRTHQIRLHMAYLGYGLIGDPLYGRRNRKIMSKLPEETREFLRDFPRQCLHSYRICFTHPATEEEMEFEVPLPKDMQEVVAALR